MDLELLKSINAATVYKGNVPAAILMRDSGNVTFHYLPEYLAAGGKAIAHTLPAREDAAPIQTSNGAVPAFFAGLLPEGFRFSQLAQELKVSPSDEYRLLLAVGGNLPGDVRVVPQYESADHRAEGRIAETYTAEDDTAGHQTSGRHPSERHTSGHRTSVRYLSAHNISDDHLSEVDVDKVLDFSGLLTKTDLVSIPGVQGKVSAGRSRRAITAAGAPDLRPAKKDRSAQQYILKYDSPKFPLLSRNEFAHVRAAHGLGVPVEAIQLVTDVHGTEGLLADRFDRVIAAYSTRITRLAMEDASQLLDLPPAAKYDPSSEDVALALVSACNAKPVARRNIFLQTAFAYLTGNGDLHAKNYSVLQGLDGSWAMAPIYDVACTLVYGDNSMALSVAGKKKDLRLKHWLEFAQTIGLPEKPAVSALKKALAVAERVDLQEIGYRGSVLSGALRTLSKRRDETARDLLG